MTPGSGLQGLDALSGPPTGLLIRGTHGDDSLSGGWDGDTILGGAGDDSISGSDGPDLLRGGSGNDVIAVSDPEFIHFYDGPGNRAYGGAGDDSIYTQVGDTADGGAGTDWFYLDLALGAETKGARLDLSVMGSGHKAVFGGTQLSGFERGYLIGTAGRDELIIGTAGISVTAGPGNDHVVTGALHAFDTGYGWIDGDGGDDLLEGGAGDDIMDGGGGRDTVTGGGGRDHLLGGGGNDLVVGSDGGGEMEGGGGDDLLQIHGLSLVFGNAGADVLQFIGDGSLGSTIGHLANEDLIDLSQVDADLTQAGDQAFERVEAFDGHAGQMTLQVVGRDTELLMDRDGDGVADASLTFTGQHADFGNFVP